MKAFKTILYFALLLLPLCSCGKHPFPRALQVADSLTYCHPDSAVTLLQQMKESILAEPEAIQMRYNLLCIKAQDKAYITHTSDSLIQLVVRYYRKHKNKTYLPEALYFAGRVYSDLGDAPQALEYFQRAINHSTEDTDYMLLSNVYSQTGMIFLFQDIYDKAPEMFRKSYHYSVLANDSDGIVYRLRDIGRSFTTLKQADSAVYYYLKADEQAIQIKHPHLRSVVYSELSGYYTELGKYEEAYKAMQIAISQKKEGRLPLYAITAQYYEHTNQLDSATYYYLKLLSTDNYIFRQGAYGEQDREAEPMKP